MGIRQLVASWTLTTGLLLAVGTGCAWVNSGPPLEERSADLAPAHVPGSALDVQAHNGGVRVQSGSGDSVVIHATLRMETVERLEGTTISADRQPDGTLRIRAIPPQGGWRSREGCGFEVTTPDASGAMIVTDNGRIEVSGVGGRLDLKTTNGAVVVHDAGGPVAVETSNGRVQVLGAHGAVTVKSSNGAVVVALAPDSAGPISARTSNGAIELTLSPAFRGTLSASTSNGRLRLPETGDGMTVTRSKKAATLTVGEGGAASEASTSNGSITVIRAGG